MRLILTTFALLFAVACSSVKPIDLADAGTTAAVIAQGGTEMNPIIGAAGDAAAPVVAVGVKYALRNIAEEGSELDDALEYGTDIAGWVGTCNNLAVMAGVAFPSSLLVGAACAVVALH